MAGLLCEEEVLEVDNVKYCGYCKYHFSKMVSPIRPAVSESGGPVSEGVGSGPGWCQVLGGQRWRNPGPALRSFATR